jgi:hypothetical protein
VSHQPERKENDCLNCGTLVHGRYCHVCGQENIVVKQSFWGLTKHFVFDIFHFDGKFFDTLRHLFFKPGTISKEYVSGKRMRYLDPIRMYLFTSAVFFLVFFSVGESTDVVDVDQSQTLSKAERLDLAMDISKQQQRNPGDTLLQHQMNLLLDSTNVISLVPFSDSVATSSKVYYQGKPFSLEAQKDSSFLQLEDGDFDNWLSKTAEQKWGNFKKKYGDDLEKGLYEFLTGFLHKLPYVLFLSLPFFAGILKLLHLRKRQIYFSDHAVFTLHHYIISFMLMLLFFSFEALQKATGWSIFATMAALMVILWPLYLLFGMKRFYGQSWGATLGKFVLVNILGLITLFLLMGFFLLFSIFQM